MTNTSPRWHRASRRQEQWQGEEDEEETGCCHDTVSSAVRGLHIVDGVMGLLFLLYGLALSAASTPARTAIVLTLLTATLLLSRAVLGGMALTTTTCQRCGLLISAHCSALLVVLYFVLGFLCLGLHHNLFRYLKNHELYLPSGLLDFLEEHVQALCTIMLVLALIELFRWGLIQRFRRRLDDDSLNQSGLSEPLLSPSRGDPPRWSYFHNYDRSSIDMQQDANLPRGTRAKKKRFNWLSNLFSRRRDDDSDIRSTSDFASVNEEWANRSEEDPLWWSREEGEGGTTRDDDNKDESWVGETPTPSSQEEKNTRNEEDIED